MIDLNGPDIETVDEVKALILESVNAWKNYKMRMPSRSSAGVTRPSRSAQGRSNVYSHLSGLEDVGFNDFIKDFPFQKVMVTSRQVLLLASLQSSINQKRIAGLNVKTKQGRSRGRQSTGHFLLL